MFDGLGRALLAAAVCVAVFIAAVCFVAGWVTADVPYVPYHDASRPVRGMSDRYYYQPPLPGARGVVVAGLKSSARSARQLTQREDPCEKRGVEQPCMTLDPEIQRHSVPATFTLRASIYDELRQLNWCPARVVWDYLWTKSPEDAYEDLHNCSQRNWSHVVTLDEPGCYQVRFKIYDSTYFVGDMVSTIDAMAGNVPSCRTGQRGAEER